MNTWLKRMQRTLLVWTLIVSAASAALPEASMPQTPKPLELAVYVTNIHNIDFLKQSFDATFWVYAHHASMDHPLDHLNVMHATHLTRTLMGRHIYPNGTYTDYAKMHATILQPMDLTHYPFDQQTLTLALEDANHTHQTMAYRMYDPTLKHDQLVDVDASPENWHIDTATQAMYSKHYQTNFGDRTQPNQTVSDQYRVTLKLKRTGMRQFIVNVILIYLSATLAILTQFIASETRTAQKRNTLLLAAIFTLSSAYVSGTQAIHHSSHFLLLDKLQILVLIVVLASFIIDHFADHIEDGMKRRLGGLNTVMVALFSAVMLLQT